MRALTRIEAAPRLIGALGLVWLVTLAWELVPFPSVAARVSYIGGWGLASALLVAGRHVRPAGIVLVALAVVGLLGPLSPLHQALALFLWAGLLLAASEGRPHERALLLRVMATVVYAFAALSKMNPSFLAGEQLLAIVRGREHWAFLVPLMAGPGGVVLSWVGVALEAAIPAGLWWRRTRTIAVAAGLLLHGTFVVLVSRGTLPDAAMLLCLNGLLVACYPAFYAPIRPPYVPEEAATGASPEGSAPDRMPG